MTKKRKLHDLKGTIKHCFLGTSKSKQWKNNPFYYLEIISESLFTEKSKTDIYAFYNLVSKEIWNTLEQETFKDKKYLFYCEKRVRGWRLKEMEEIPNQ